MNLSADVSQIMVECGNDRTPEDPQPYIDASEKVISQLSDQVNLFAVTLLLVAARRTP
jgi:hypothetical protein